MNIDNTEPMNIETYEYRQHRTSNTHRAVLIENAPMIEPIKGCTEIHLQDPILLPTLQCTLQCMEHWCTCDALVMQKCITSTQTFPIRKLGSWKHTTAFHKSSKTNRHQALNNLRQYWCYGNQSVIGNRGGRRTFRNRGAIGLSKANPDKQAAETLH